MAEKQNSFIQDYETISKIISMALGGESKEKEAPIPKNMAEAQVMMAKVFGRR